MNSSVDFPVKRQKLESVNDFDGMANNESFTLTSTEQEIDEGLYSRQLYVLGHDAMRRMATKDILVSGLGGLGVEVAKNVILSGVKSVSLHDETLCTIADLSSQFYLSSDDIGKNRAEACFKPLSELNMYVPIYTYTGSLTEDFLRRFSIVVLTNSSMLEQLRISEITHRNKIALIIADVRGLFAQVFCDFGADFTVVDVNGETPVSVLVSDITRDSNGSVVITCFDEIHHGLEDEDYVTFSEIQGMTELNNCEPVKVKVLDPYTFSIEIKANLSKYMTGGMVQQIKMPKVLNFKSLQESIKTPVYLITNSAKFSHAKQMHLAFKALHKYTEKFGVIPKPWNADDAIEFISLANSLTVDGINNLEANMELLEKFSYTCAGNISPMNATIGGIVAQEVIKACSGKFYPIYQWLYFDSIECLPTNVISEILAAPVGSRYDGQIAVFGRDFQEKLGAQKYFIAGAGAIGCELLKNFAMIGIGSTTGLITVTDMGLIEKSNLNRQFLFRPHDIQRSKATTAAMVIRKMNPDINIIAHENPVGPDTENIYNDEFFESLDGIASALDNIDARIYMNGRSIYYRKPLLESDILGTEGRTQVIVPYLTESYNFYRDLPEKRIPICTLRNFPYTIEHTLQWARDNFEYLFKESVEDASQYLSEPNFIEQTLKLPGEQQLEVLRSLKLALVDDRPKNIEDCVKWARNHWEEQYVNQIKQLLFNFPPNQLTSEGHLFWSGSKRCPQPLTFDAENSLHLDYIVAATNLKAEVYGIPQMKDRSTVTEIAQKVVLSEFVPKFDVNIGYQLGGSSKPDVGMDRVSQLQQELPSPGELKGVNIQSIEFKKDDNNFHMDFIVAASNLRAMNYNITCADRHKAKLIAGKIIPAITTTTSVIGGLVCLELYKLINGIEKLEPFKNGFINLALPSFGFYKPIAAPKMEYCGNSWTLWDRFDVQGEMTLKDFLKYFKEKHGLNITILSQGVRMLYSTFMAKSKAQERLSLSMTELVKKVSQQANIEPHVRALVFELLCNDADDNDVEVPYVKYTLP